MLNEQKLFLNQLEHERAILQKNKFSITQLLSKISFLLDEAKQELKEIERIRFVNKKLNLFSPNTCPYCLTTIDRPQNKCICGCEVDETQYEKFFYTDTEYLTILKIKQKSIKTLTELLKNKYTRKGNIERQIDSLILRIEKTQKYVIELNKDIQFNNNYAYIQKLNEQETSIELDIIKINQIKDLSIKKEELVHKVSNLRSEMEKLKNKVDKCFSSAKEDIYKKRKTFDRCYLQLMKSSDNKCYDAYIGEDYMPVINLSEYRERSASVSKRLMYFLTLLIQSINNDDIKFPQFLMVDTPNKEGIDVENLMTCLTLFSRVNEASIENNNVFQIILTTGIGLYPSQYKENVFLTLSEDNYLLKEK